MMWITDPHVLRERTSGEENFNGEKLRTETVLQVKHNQFDCQEMTGLPLKSNPMSFHAHCLGKASTGNCCQAYFKRNAV